MPAKKRATSQSSRYRFQYAAKFICTSHIPGTSQTTDSFLPGNYQTVVNIHNPNERSVRFRAKVALGGQGLISKFIDGGLGPDEVTRYVCRDIREKFGLNLIHGAEGFLVIESTLSLDVIAVYTAGPLGGGVASIDVEDVRERRLPIK
jgi:hypothetical protein